MLLINLYWNLNLIFWGYPLKSPLEKTPITPCNRGILERQIWGRFVVNARSLTGNKTPKKKEKRLKWLTFWRIRRIKLCQTPKFDLQFDHQVFLWRLWVLWVLESAIFTPGNGRRALGTSSWAPLPVRAAAQPSSNEGTAGEDRGQRQWQSCRRREALKLVEMLFSVSFATGSFLEKSL